MSRKPTPQQDAAIRTTGKHLCVDAGAGCGKTFVLVERVMHLLDRDVPLSRIVAITFTRKAATEMKERLRAAIHSRPDQADPHSMTKWRNIEYQVETARITTIDSFCMGLLREHALRLDLDPEFTVLADAETQLLRNDTVAECLEDLLNRHNDAAHRLVVEYGHRATRELLVKAVGLPDAFEWALDTYAEDDAEALTKRWARDTQRIQTERRAKLPGGPEVATFVDELESYAGLCTRDDNAREVARREMLGHLHRLDRAAKPQETLRVVTALAIYSFGRTGNKNDWPSKDCVEALKKLQDEITAFFKGFLEPEVDADIEREAAQRTLDILQVYAAARDAWTRAKEKRAAKDFGDLLAGVTHLFAHDPDARRQIASSIDHLLIDEFQDTNSAQLEMARALMRDTKAAGAELFVVGDAKQSIYRFRGAEVNVFHDVKNIVDKTVPLTHNYRSYQEILSFVHDVFERARLLHRVEPELSPLQAKRDAGGGGRISILMPHEIDTASADDYRRIEARLIAAYIADASGPNGKTIVDPHTDTTRPPTYGDIAILFRGGSSIPIYEDALREAGIPARVVEGAGFFTRQEIIDFRNLLTAAIDPWNEVALAAFLRGPYVAVTDDTLYELARSGGLAQALYAARPVRADRDAKVLDRARTTLDDIRARLEWPLTTLVRWILERTGIEAVVLAQAHGIQKASNLRKLVGLAGDFAHAGRPSLSAFVQYLATVANREIREGDAELLAEEAGAVTLMSIHKAKGLEFPIAVIADMGRKAGGDNASNVEGIARCGLAAKVNAADRASEMSSMGVTLNNQRNDADAEEEARILYVAMTRARDYLVLSGPPNATRTTWMATLIKLLRLQDSDDRSEIRGEGWSGTVLRTVPTSFRASTKPRTSTALPDVETLVAQCAALDLSESPDPTLPVSDILDRLHPDTAGEPSETEAPLRLDQLGAAMRGTLIHNLLERWAPGRIPPIDAVLENAALSPFVRKEAASLLERFAAGLDSSNLAPIWRDAGIIERELPFTYKLNGATLHGTIDALVDRDLLVDYKTGARDNNREKRYRAQLCLYAAAIEQIRGAAPKRACLYYTESDEWVDVDVSPDALAETLGAAHKALATADA